MVLLVPRQEGPELPLLLLLVAERTGSPSSCLAWLLAACHQSPAWRSWTCHRCLLPCLLSLEHLLGPKLLQLCLQGEQQWVPPGHLALWIPLQGLVLSGTLHG